LNTRLIHRSVFIFWYIQGRNQIKQPQARHFATTCISTLTTESCQVFAT